MYFFRDGSVGFHIGHNPSQYVYINHHSCVCLFIQNQPKPSKLSIKQFIFFVSLYNIEINKFENDVYISHYKFNMFHTSISYLQLMFILCTSVQPILHRLFWFSITTCHIYIYIYIYIVLTTCHISQTINSWSHLFVVHTFFSCD